MQLTISKDTNMSVLAGLKVANTSRRDANNSTQRRRAKLVEKLEEQLQGAEALISGMSFQTTKRITQTNQDGEVDRVTVPKRFRAWYWHDISGVWFLEVRYGARALKLNKSGATSIVVGERDKLVDTIRTVIEAVRAGELDAAIEEAAKR